jgi:homocitrate synthase NifV
MRAKLRLDRQGTLARIRDVVSYAVDSGLRVAMGGEDSSRADIDFLPMAVEAAEGAGAHRFRYADTLGGMEPFGVFDVFARLRKETAIELEYHGHDDLGLATANTLAAIRGGAAAASVCVLGLGERAGNAALEEVAAGLYRFFGNCGSVDLAQLPHLAELVARAAGRPIPVGKSIVGANAFTHESGIHVDGLLKDPSTYEELSPQMFGRVRTVVLGKHSGMASVRDALQALGLFADTSRTKNVLEQVKERSIEAKRIIRNDELLDFYRRAGHMARPTSPHMEMRYDCA